MKTIVGVGDPKAVKRWSANLFLDVRSKSYFEKKFIGTSDQSVVQRLTDLEADAGDTISFDLSLQLRKRPIYGDDRAQGKSEELKFATDEIKIDQMRAPVSAGGRMTRKRTLHDLRRVAKDRLGDYWSAFMDEMMFIYLSGARGINEDYIEDVTWVGHAGNAIQAPDADHHIIVGAGTKAGLTSSDIMTRTVIERASVKAQMMRATNPENASMLPSSVEGEPRYVMVMSPFQSHQLRTSTPNGDWLDIQKAAAGAEGRANPIFRGSLGMIDNVVMHSHERVIRFSDYGSGSDLPAARAVFLGRQAGVVAYGTSGGTRFQWNEEKTDFENQVDIAAGTICGLKKTRFKGRDFGVISVDTYAPDPNA